MKARQFEHRGAKGLAVATVQIIILLIAGIAHAVTVSATHSVAGDTYPFAGGTINVAVNLSQSGAGSLLSLGLTETLPAGWTFNAVVSGPVPIVKPASGASTPLEFAWGTVPSLPATFVYRVNVPARGTLPQTVSGQALCVDNLGQDQQSTVTSVVVEPDQIVVMPLQVYPLVLGLMLAGLMAMRRYRKTIA